MVKLISALEAAKEVQNGDTVMLGGFGKFGYALEIIQALYTNTDTGDLTFIMNSAHKQAHVHLEKLLELRCKYVICSFMRNSNASQKLFLNGQAKLLPQGTLAESIRLGGMGIPAYYNPIGIGTIVADGKEVRIFDGKEYLLENTLRGNVALFRASKVDLHGNCFLRGATKNFCLAMALACDKVYVEASELVEEPLNPEYITVPGILIDGIVKVGAVE